MPEDKPIVQVARWYNERLNEPYYPNLIKDVASSTDLSLRRSDTRIGNAFHDISGKLEQIGYHVHTIAERLKRSLELLPIMLQDLKRDIGSNIDGHLHAARNSDRRVEFYDYILNSHIESMLIQGKALLDSTSQFYSIAFKRNIRTFGDSGDNLLNDIGNLPGGSKEYAGRLRVVVEGGKQSWIDNLIEYRDSVVHFGQLRGMYGPMLRLDERIEYRLEDVSPAVMPNGVPVEPYANSILHSAHSFEKDMMIILFERLREIHARRQ
jgi:hypothetical protein